MKQQQRDIYESHRHRTFSLAFYMTGNEMEAEEILATTFIRAFQQNEQPDGFAVDSALVNELSQRFPLKEEEARRGYFSGDRHESSQCAPSRS